MKQQKVIRHLLQKKGSTIDPNFLDKLLFCNTNGAHCETNEVITSATSQQNSKDGKIKVDSDTLLRQKRLLQSNWSSIKSDPDFQAATDSDSAIMLEDHIAEVSLSSYE